MNEYQDSFDFGGEEEQQERKYGPVPAGSRVLLRMTLEEPKYKAPHNPFLAQAKSGLLQLPVKFEVATGEYEGVHFWDYITLPANAQRITLTDGQVTSCRIGGAQLRAILESARGIDPKDKSERAAAGRRTQSWQQFHGLEFPARLGLSDEPSEYKGKLYWNNVIGKVLPCTDPDYGTIKQGGEIITDGPVAGDASAARRNGGYENYSGGDPFGGPDYPEPPAQMDQVPF